MLKDSPNSFSHFSENPKIFQRFEKFENVGNSMYLNKVWTMPCMSSFEGEVLAFST